MHEADEPDAVIDFLDSDSLAGQAGAEIDLLAVKAKTATVGDDDGLVLLYFLSDRTNSGAANHSCNFRELSLEWHA